jgi:aminopeptidase N
MSSEKEILLSALGCTREQWLINRFLNRSLSNEGIRKQDTFRVFSTVSTSVYGQPVAFTFLRENWKLLRQQ